MPLAFLVLLAYLSFIGCDDEPVETSAAISIADDYLDPSSPRPLGVGRSSPQDQELWLSRSPTRHCALISAHIAEVTGTEAENCGERETMRDAIKCVNDAFQQKSTFALCEGGLTMDSVTARGVAGTSSGNLVFFHADTAGPAYKGVCLRQNVLLSRKNWPACRRALVDRIDLRSGEPYLDDFQRYFTWSAGCRARAERAKRFVFPPKMTEPAVLVSDPDRWDVSCEQFSTSFEVLIDEEGRVVCTAIGELLSPPGLAEEVRGNLSRLRFEPPVVYATPVEARWGMRASRCDPFSIAPN